MYFHSTEVYVMTESEMDNSSYQGYSLHSFVYSMFQVQHFECAFHFSQTSSQESRDNFGNVFEIKRLAISIAFVKVIKYSFGVDR